MKIILILILLPKFILASIIHEWKTIEFDTRCRENDTEYDYDPTHVIPSGIKIYGNRIFLSSPRLFDGVPATLSSIPLNSNERSPKLHPFPSWKAQKIGDCSALQSVEGFEIDRLGRMWILDSGNVASFGPSPQFPCKPRLIIVDLNIARFPNVVFSRADCSIPNTAKTVRVYEFPEDQVDRKTALLDDLVIDSKGNGWYAYITSVTPANPGLIVYSFNENRSWLIKDNATMSAQFPSITVNGTTVPTATVGTINGIALSPLSNTNRYVYFCPVASKNLYAIHTRFLQNSKISPSEISKNIIKVGTKNSIQDGMMMDNTGRLFFSQPQDNAAAVWQSSRYSTLSASTYSFQLKDDENLIWLDTFAFDNKGSLYFTANKLQQLLTNTIDPKINNFRIFKLQIGARSYQYNSFPLRSES